jgi:hypothetical protein
MTELSVGTRILVYYEDVDEWHERLLTAHVTDEKWSMLTPDEDHYVVDLEKDVDDWEEMGPRGGAPARCRRAALVYKFERQYTAGQLADIYREGRVIASDERKALGLDVPIDRPRRLVGKGPEARPVLPLGGNAGLGKHWRLTELVDGHE